MRTKGRETTFQYILSFKNRWLIFFNISLHINWLCTLIGFLPLTKPKDSFHAWSTKKKVEVTIFCLLCCDDKRKEWSRASWLERKTRVTRIGFYKGDLIKFCVCARPHPIKRFDYVAREIVDNFELGEREKMKKRKKEREREKKEHLKDRLTGYI